MDTSSQRCARSSNAHGLTTAPSSERSQKTSLDPRPLCHKSLFPKVMTQSPNAPTGAMSQAAPANKVCSCRGICNRHLIALLCTPVEPPGRFTAHPMIVRRQYQHRLLIHGPIPIKAGFSSASGALCVCGSVRGVRCAFGTWARAGRVQDPSVAVSARSDHYEGNAL